jgi:predicted helicase
VNKFLAESGRAVFTYRMLIATTNLIDRIGERTIQDQEKYRSCAPPSTI